MSAPNVAQLHLINVDDVAHACVSDTR